MQCDLFWFVFLLILCLCDLSILLHVALGPSQVALVIKNPPTSTGDVRDIGLIPRSGGGRGTPLQNSCLENPMDRGDW